MFTIFALDVEFVFLNIPLNFEYELTIGKDHKKPHPKPAAAMEE